MKKNISILLFLLLFNHPSYTMYSSKSLEDCQDSNNQIASPYISLFRKLVLNSAQREKDEEKEVLDIEKGVQANPKDSRDSLRSVTHSIFSILSKDYSKTEKVDKAEEEVIDIELGTDGETITVSSLDYSSEFTYIDSSQENKSDKYLKIAYIVSEKWMQEELSENLILNNDISQMKRNFCSILKNPDVEDIKKNRIVFLNSFVDKIYYNIKDNEQEFKKWNAYYNIIFREISVVNENLDNWNKEFNSETEYFSFLESEYASYFVDPQIVEEPVEINVKPESQDQEDEFKEFVIKDKQSKKSKKKKKIKRSKKSAKAKSKNKAKNNQSIPRKQIVEVDNSLVDDIVKPTRWLINPINPTPETLKKDFINSNKVEYIRKRQYYRPALVKDNQALIVFIVVHGTWQQACAKFFQDVSQDVKELNGLVYNHIKKLAAFYATAKMKNLELLSLKWKGGLWDGCRTDGSAFLKQLIDDTKSYRDAELVLLGHSHGCNVINDFSNRLSIEKPIALLIYFGCPRKEEIKYQPRNYKVLLYFHSDSDWFTVAGRNHKKAALSTALPIGIGGVIGGGLGYYFGSKHDSEGAAKMAADMAQDAAKAKADFLAKHKGKLVGTAAGATAGAAIGTVPAIVIFKYVMHGTNHFPSSDRAITVGFRVKKDSWNSDHGGLMDVVKYLPRILEKVMIDYRRHYFHSGNFHLNIDTKASETEDPIFLVIADKEDAKAIDYPDSTDVISLKTEEEEYLDKSWSLRATEDEKYFSEAEEAQYKGKYNNYDIKENYFREGAWF